MDARRLCWYIIFTTNVTLVAYIAYFLYAYRPAKVEVNSEIELKLFENHFYEIFHGDRFNGAIYFSNDIDPDDAGVCYYGGSTILANIRINPTKWKYYSQYAKEELIFHEMGHCLYGLSHDDENTFLPVLGKIKECPRSLMNSDTPVGGECYEYNRDYYIKEFRDKIRKPLR